MRTIIINGSPKGNSKNSNSKIICEEFVREMNLPCEIKCIADADMEDLARYIEAYETVIFILPLYIYAMPGIMMDFLQHVRPAAVEGKSLGFIIQAGFIETEQTKYVERYFASFAELLNYNYLGTVSKGEAAAIYMFPQMFKKVLKKFNDLGRMYELTHAFDRKIVQELGKPYRLTKPQAHIFQFFCDIGLNNLGWHKMLKKNNAYAKRLEKPFLY